MRGWLRPLVLPLLRRDPEEVAVRAREFTIRRPGGRRLVSRLGRAFLDGYHAMLEARKLEEVEASAASVHPHYRPFFYEGAAMGYLPRSYYSPDCRAEHAERDLLALAPGQLYLFYVGLGFWYGFRHPARPDRLLALEAHLDPFYFPLCFDGYGFKLCFFDGQRPERVRRILDRAPAAFQEHLHQGYGRALFFRYMDDDTGYQAVKQSFAGSRRDALELGRSLAVGFTGADRPRELLEYVAAAAAPDELSARLCGVTWAVTARRLGDPDYFDRCLDALDGRDRQFLRSLPDLCHAERDRAGDYDDWQARTRDTVTAAYARHCGGASRAMP